MIKECSAIFAFLIIVAFYVYRYKRKQDLNNAAKIFMKSPSDQWMPLKRSEMIIKMKTEEFDICVIGGGSSGVGCAMDAATRGLKVCMINDGDFASETSSKSTKILHGGIRYLGKAFKKLDINQLKIVIEALSERKVIMNIAPFLCNSLEIIFPVYQAYMIPYYWIGLKIYDYISGTASLGPSTFNNKATVIERFPAVKKKNLKGAIFYFDGQFDDSRLNVLLAMTASYYGAVVANYVKAEGYVMSDNGHVTGVKCEDKETNEKFVIKSKCVINATGAFADKVRSFEKKGVEKIVTPSSGVHLVIPKEYAPIGMGLAIKTSNDKSILFILPLKDKTLVGSTDNKCSVIEDIKPYENEVQFLLDEIAEHTEYPEMLKRNEISAVWSGIRPLLRGKNKNTEELVRSYKIYIGDNNVLTVSGGKWTTYRKMAEETIKTAIKTFNLKPERICVTKCVQILGAHGFDEGLHLRLKMDLNLNIETSKHLARTYGNNAYKFRSYIDSESKKLCEGYEYLEKEIEYCIDYEMAIKIMDFLARRTGLAFIDVKAANSCIEKVADIMGKKLGWSNEKRQQEIDYANAYLNTLGIEFCSK